jgi:hypothetical protein
LSELVHDARQLAHRPGGPVDPKVTWWLMKDAKERLFDGIVVKFSVWIDSTCEQQSHPTFSKDL